MLALATWLVADVAAAQSDAFTEGVVAYDEGRNEEALSSFLAAFEQSGNPQILINVAASQARLGRHADAVRTYRRMIASEDPRALRHRTLAQQGLDDALARVAVIVVDAPLIVQGDRLELDGLGVEPNAEVAVNPGERHVSARRGEQVVAEMTVAVSAGERRVVQLILPQPLPVPEVARVPTPAQTARAHQEQAATASMLRQHREAPLVESPWLWIGVGAGVLVAVGVIAGVAFGTSSPPAETFAGTFEPGLIRVN